MLDQLLATPGVQERCGLGSAFGFLALHGGLEAGTAEIAQAAAIASNASIYAVVQPRDVLVRLPMPRGGNRPSSHRIRRLPIVRC